MTGRVAVLLSREELEVLEACCVIVIDQHVLPKEDEHEAVLVLAEIRKYLDDLYEKEMADAQTEPPEPGVIGAVGGDVPGEGRADPAP